MECPIYIENPDRKDRKYYGFRELLVTLSDGNNATLLRTSERLLVLILVLPAD